MTASTKDDSRYHALDSLRAVMMMLGVLLHTAISYGTIPFGAVWPYKDPATHWVCDVTVILIHMFRMPLFFVLAGFFAALLRDRRGLDGMLKNRAQRIVLPFLVGWVILSPLVRFAFYFALKASKSPLLDLPEMAGSGNPLAAFYGDATLHLWFLYYLIFFYLGAALLDRLAGRLGEATRERFRGAFRRVAGSVPLRALVLGGITAVSMLPNPYGALLQSNSFLPEIDDLLANFVFFGVGWLLYGCRDLIPDLKRLAWTQILLAWLVLFPIASIAQGRELEHIGLRLWPEHLVACFVGGPMTWMLIFGITGVFLRYFDRPIPVLRYLTDASYWVYLAHLPLVIALAGLLANLPLPALVKAGLVLGMSMAILLVSYHFGVRSTAIGAFLNGRRYPLRAKDPEPTAEVAPVLGAPQAEPAAG